MPDPRILEEAGPWAAVVALLVGFIVASALALRRRWFVPGWMFDRAERRAAKAEAEARLNAKSLESLSAAYAVMAKAYDRLERDVSVVIGAQVKRE